MGSTDDKRRGEHVRDVEAGGSNPLTPTRSEALSGFGAVEGMEGFGLTGGGGCCWVAGMATFSGSTFNLSMTRDMIDVTSDRPSSDPNWRYTDRNGHEHRYDHGYPTLDLVVDAEHWCDGNEGYARHDPHMHVDEAHYECLICREVVKPGKLPPSYPQAIPGMINCEVGGYRSDGAFVCARILKDEYEMLRTGPSANIVAAFLDQLPAERIISITYRQ
jgi:hypothetical protein